MEVQKLSKTYSVRRLGEEDLERILALSEKNELFYQYHPPFVTRESIFDDMRALPPGKTQEDKYYVGFFEGDMLVAIMDLILDYPEETTAYIGLFMVECARQGMGIGTAIIGEVVSFLSGHHFQKIKLAIDRGNPQSEAFWKKNAFAGTEENLEKDGFTYLSMEREIAEFY